MYNVLNEVIGAVVADSSICSTKEVFDILNVYSGVLLEFIWVIFDLKLFL